VIRIHRVVKEVSPGRPAKKMEGILLLPGLPQLFEGIFMQAPLPGHPVDESSIALYLAAQRHRRVGHGLRVVVHPYPTSDFGFLSGWGSTRTRGMSRPLCQSRAGCACGLNRATARSTCSGSATAGFSCTRRPAKTRSGLETSAISRGSSLSTARRSRPCRAASSKRILQQRHVRTGESGCGCPSRRLQRNHDSRLAALNYPTIRRRSRGAVVQPPFPAFPAFPANTFTNFQASQVNSVRGKTLGGTYTVSPPSVTLFFAEGLRIARCRLSHPRTTRTSGTMTTRPPLRKRRLPGGVRRSPGRHRCPDLLHRPRGNGVLHDRPDGEHRPSPR